MDSAIQVKNVSRRISKKFGIKDVSFDIKKGYVTGIIGTNGAGKTTLIKMIMGLVLKESGDITFFDGQDIESYRINLGYVSDSPRYIGDFSLWKNAKFIKNFYPNWNEEKFDNYMKEFELDEQKNFDSLSKGMKIKFALAIALSHEPDVLILDEPTAGIDPVFRIQMLNILYDFVSDNKKAVVMSTHITSDLDKIADYILFVENGQIVLNDEKDVLLSTYSIIQGQRENFDESLKNKSVAFSYDMGSFKALVNTKDIEKNERDEYVITKPSLEDLMFLYGKRDVK